jgi:NAD(P)-dependent dehydrogenase (short-subunit alcohol dehydrogenase family)
VPWGQVGIRDAGRVRADEGLAMARERIAVITGAASGIGRALAVELAQRGAGLALSDIDGLGLARIVETCRATGVRVHHEVVDVSDRDAVVAHAAAVTEHLGAPTLVVANAGIAASGTVLGQAHEDVRRVIEVDLFGVIHTCQAFLPLLQAGGGGRLVTVSSVFGLVAAPKQSAYNAAKFGVRGYTESLRQELGLARSPITVSCVHPGAVRTAIARSALYAPDEDEETLMRFLDRMAWTSPTRAARTILRGAAADRARILVGSDARLMELTARVGGAAYTDLVSRSWLGRWIFGATGR